MTLLRVVGKICALQYHFLDVDCTWNDSYFMSQTGNLLLKPVRNRKNEQLIGADSVSRS
jgi:hypothetical protein